MGGPVSRTGARRLGDDYQDLIAIHYLLQVFENPGRYESFRVEADDAGALDDVVGKKSDGGLLLRQVKYSVHPEDPDDPWSWDTLLDRTPPTSARSRGSTSLVQKWSKALLLFAAEVQIDAAVETNRRAAADLSACLRDERIQYELVPDEVKRQLVDQIGSDEDVKRFLSAMRFRLEMPGIASLEDGLFERFKQVGGTREGWLSLRDSVRLWMRDRTKPSAGGAIRPSDIQHAAEWRRLQALPEDFRIPPDFVVPSDAFEEEVLARLSGTPPASTVIVGPPGAGKSTYLSHLHDLLRKMTVPVVRHHYYLAGSRGDRLDWQVVATSLMAELQRAHGDQFPELAARNSSATDLGAWLTRVGEWARSEGKSLVIILDGLDHIRRDTHSLAALGHLLDLILPLPPGCQLVLGTQPMSEEGLPARLIEAAPRRDWLELPFLDRGAMRQWIEKQGEILQLPEAGPHRDETLSRLSEKLHAHSGGHPLYLTYVVAQLRSTGSRLTEFDVDALPACPDGHIRDYYQATWAALRHAEGKRVLALIASCGFPIRRSGILATLDPTGASRAGYDEALREVVHFLKEGPLGFDFFHSSLPAHLLQNMPAEQVLELRTAALAWLRCDAPDYIRWREEWRLAGSAGDASPLISGTTHEWVVRSLADGRPAREIRLILWNAARSAATVGDFPAFARIGTLHDYVYELDDQREDTLVTASRALDTLHPTSVRLEAALTNLAHHPGEALADLAVLAASTGLTDETELIEQELYQRARYRPARYGNENTLTTRVQPWMRSAMAAGDIEGLKTTITRNRPDHSGRLSHMAAREARRVRNLAALRALIIDLDDPERVSVSDEFVLLAAEEGADLPPELQQLSDQSPSIAAVSAMKALHSPPASLPDEQAASNLDKEPTVMDEPRITPFLNHCLWGFLSNAVAGHSAKSREWLRELKTHEWMHGFLDAFQNAVSDLAQDRKDPRTWDLAAFHTKLAKHAPPDGYDWKLRQMSVGAKLIAESATVCVCCLRGGGRLNLAEAQAMLASPYMGASAMLDLCLSTDRPLFAPEAYEACKQQFEAEVLAPIDSFEEKAKNFGRLATFAVLHTDRDGAGRLVDAACACLISHGWHKDMLLTDALEIIQNLARAQVGDSHSEMIRITPAIIAIRELTDGDETQHLPAKLSDVIADLDHSLLLRWYASLTESASDLREDLLEALLKRADLSEGVTHAIAETSAERSLRRVVGERAASDPQAAEVEAALAVALGSPPTGDYPGDDTKTAKPDLAPSQYPPEKLAEFSERARELQLYGAHDAWARYWAGTTQAEAALDALDMAERNGVNVRSKYVRYQMAVKANGRQAAYHRLVDAFRDSHGWDSYYSRDEAEGAWRIVIDHHDPIQFVKDTILPDEGWVWNLGRYRTKRIVEFFIRAKKTDLAAEVAEAYLDEVAQLLSAQAIPSPSWLVETA